MRGRPGFEANTRLCSKLYGRVPKVTTSPTSLGKGGQGLECSQAALHGALGEGVHVDRPAVQERVDASGLQGRREKKTIMCRSH